MSHLSATKCFRTAISMKFAASPVGMLAVHQRLAVSTSAQMHFWGMQIAPPDTTAPSHDCCRTAGSLAATPPEGDNSGQGGDYFSGAQLGLG